MYELRPYQQKGVGKALDYVNDLHENKKELIVAPCGSGKSLLIGAIANSIEEPVIVIQPNKELLEQNYEKYVSYGNTANICSASMGSKEIGHVTFGTIGTLKNKVEEFKEVSPRVVIVDEAHRASKKSSDINKFLNELGITKVIGLTATPIELRTYDGEAYLAMINRSQKNIFDDILHVTQVSEMVDEGYWTDIHYEIPALDESMLVKNTTGTDYTMPSLRNYYYENSIERRIEKKTAELKNEGKKSILIFVPSIEDAEQLSSQIPDSSVIHSKMKAKERNQVVKDFKNLDLSVLINIDIAGLGFDHPQLDGIIMARPTGSFAVYYQQAARGVRPHAEKENCKIIDLAGNIRKFGKLENISFEQEEGRWGMFAIKGDDEKEQLTLGTVYKNKSQEVIWFGKHKGKKLKDLPKGYLEWITSDAFTPFSSDVAELCEKAKKYV